MDDHISASLDNLELGNLNQKLKTMRDKLRKDVSHDIQYMQFKMNLNGEKDSDPNSRNRSPGSLSIQNEQDVLDEFLRSSNPHRLHNHSNQHEAAPQQPQYYINVEIEEKPIDFEEIKRLSGKKISEAQWDEYIKCTLTEDIIQRLRELFDEMEDENSKVNTKQFILKIGKMGVKLSEASAIEVPIIKRKITLKKVAFQLYNKTKKLQERITWKEFKQSIQDYRFSPQPSIDVYMASQNLKPKNHFNLSLEIINELKSIYLKCAKEMFLSYCPLSSLLSKIDRSKIIQNNLGSFVRPKSNYEVEVSLKDTIVYITSQAPQFVDQDQFLLFFTVKGFTYYPIQLRTSRDIGSTLSSEQSKHIKRVRSDRGIPKQPKKKHPHFSEYFLSTNNPNSIRNNKLKQMIKEQSLKKQTETKKSFKARPLPKSISKQKYQQFVTGIQHKLQQGRQTLEQLRSQSQSELQRLKKETKLFVSPKKNEIQQHYYQITARPPPQTIKQRKLQQIQNEKVNRRHKIFSQTQIKYQHSWKQLPLVATLDLSPKNRQNQAKHTYKIPIRDIPDYHAEQIRIQQQLDKKKRQFHPTQPQPFYFHTETRHPRVDSHPSQPSQQTIDYDYKEIIYSPEPEIYYTQKFADMVVANKKKAYQKQKKVNQQLQEEIERQKRHQNFASFMKANLRKIPDTAKICENEAKIKIERHKKYWKNLDRQHQNNLNELYAKILKRPFLYELQSARHAPQNHELPTRNHPKQSKKVKKQTKKGTNRSL